MATASASRQNQKGWYAFSVFVNVFTTLTMINNFPIRTEVYSHDALHSEGNASERQRPLTAGAEHGGTGGAPTNN